MFHHYQIIPKVYEYNQLIEYVFLHWLYLLLKLLKVYQDNIFTYIWLNKSVLNTNGNHGIFKKLSSSYFTIKYQFLIFIIFIFVQFSSVSHVQLFVTPWTAAHQASLSITNFQSLLKLMSIESVMLSSHLILCHPLFFSPSNLPASVSFPMSQSFASGCQSIGVSASTSVLPMNIQDWFPLELTDLTSL